jgi:hypothetical protein
MANAQNKKRKHRAHLKTSDARVFIHTGKTSKRLHIGIIMTEAQERRMYAMLHKRYGVQGKLAGK